jgi:sRNA-binding protein
MWFKIDPHELAVFIALEGEPMGHWEKDMYVAARRQAEAMLRRSAKRGFGRSAAQDRSELEPEPESTQADPEPRFRHRAVRHR